MGLTDIKVEQTIHMVSYFMINGTSYTLTGEAMESLTEQAQIKIGMGILFVQLHFEEFGTWTTKTWLKTMWPNLGNLEIKLRQSDLTSLSMHREGDTYIIAEFSGMFYIDKITMRRMNRVFLST